mgnify:CR=1 FL=1
MLFVYIDEAHSTKWPLAYSHEQPPANHLAERIAYAQAMSREFGLAEAGRVLVDPMELPFETAFGAWPGKYFVIGTDKCLEYVGQATAATGGKYDINQLLNFVRAHHPPASTE